MRELGVGLVKPRAFASPFWQLVNFSVGLCIVALILTGIVGLTLPTVHYISASSELQFQGVAYQSLNLSLSGTRVGDGPIEGDLYADLVFKDGNLATLQIQIPTRHYRLTDAEGHASEWSRTAFGGKTVLDWLAAGGIERSGPDGREMAQAIQPLIDFALTHDGGVSGGPHYAAGGTNSSQSTGPPEFFIPASVMGWSMLWLAGVWGIVRSGKRGLLRSQGRQA